MKNYKEYFKANNIRYKDYFTDVELTWSGYQFQRFTQNDIELWENKYTGAMLVLKYDYNKEKYGVIECINTPFKV